MEFLKFWVRMQPAKVMGLGTALAIIVVSWRVFPATGPVDDSNVRAASRLRDRSKASTAVLEAFQATTATAREGVVRFEVDGSPKALGTVVDPAGLVLTKASEIAQGTMVCFLANGREVTAQILAIDEDNDLALVKLDAGNLRPVVWERRVLVAGQWAVTPGLGILPETVGIVSVPARKILPKRAYIGVRMDFAAAGARIAGVVPGLGAERADLRAGDVILSINELPVKTSEDVVNTLRTFREGQAVNVRVRRDDEEWDTSIQLQGAKPDRNGLGFDRQERMNRLGGELSQRAEGFQAAIQHDGVLQPWQCGGPLLNSEGKAIGLNIARAGRVASYALPASLIESLLANLKNKAGLRGSDSRSDLR